MNARLEEVVTYADAARAHLLDALDAIAPPKWTQRSDADGWSIRDVVEHLHLVEKSSLRAMFRALRNAKGAGVAAESDAASLAPLIATIEGRMHEGKRVAPEYTRPASEATPEELKGLLAESRQGLHTWAQEADGTALETVTFPHPALGELSLYGWVVMLGAHERRHTEQIRRIVESLSA
jgi:uncharacterized damage-inducible protein DinB